MSTRSRLLCVVLAVCAMSLSACKEIELEAADTGYEPATLAPVAGSDDVTRVTFTAESAARAGVRLAEIRRSGGHKVAPYAALLYDPAGKTYIYASSGPLTFIRRQVQVARIDGDVVVLAAGPPVHTKVVTVGAAEVYGAELDVAGSH
jgi:hypothetical protein